MTTSTDATAFDSALAMARQALYRFASVALLDPRAGSWDHLDTLRQDPLLLEAAAFLRDLPSAQAAALAPGERPLSDLDPIAVLTRLPPSQHTFSEHYENTFGLLVSNACPPYETEYINGKFSFQRSNTLADISGFYRAFGVTVSQQHAERPDHIVQELEFMACLIGLARQADQADAELREERLQVCHEAQARFLQEHLTWWAPAFATLLAREDPDGFYEAAAIFLSALMAAERSLFELPAATQPTPAPSRLEKPEACDGCELA